MRIFSTAVLCAVLLAADKPPAAFGQAAPVVTVMVDASRVTSGLLHVHETVPVTAGPLTLVYPKWIPGEHAPNGPIVNLAGLRIAAGGATLTWRRDDVDMYAFHLTVPAGTARIDVDFDYLGAQGGQYSSNRLATPNMLSLTWNKVLLTPQVADYAALTIAPQLTLPAAEWNYATALETASKSGATVTFKPVTMELLVDSPLDAGTNSRRWQLGTFDGAPVDIVAFADTPAQLDASDARIEKLRNLVGEMEALYHGRHFNHYTFLLTVSDVLPGEGVEHHQSSDDGTDGSFLTDDSSFQADGDLLPHEFNHSWDGKFRRPYDLATRNLSDPMHDDLLWVYEGMTQFYGDLQAERSGIRSKQQWLDELAGTWAYLDTTTGRTTRPLLDTAVAAPFLYGAPRQFNSRRRAVDFYPEGEMMWLEADVRIRRMSGGRRSLDDVARAFFGRTSTGPEVLPYHREDLIAAMNAVQPYDWASFFHARVDEIAVHPPDFFTPGGYKLVFTPAKSATQRLLDGKRGSVDARYSLGLGIFRDGTIGDVIAGMPADKAGIGPGLKIIGVNGRSISGLQDQLDTALRDAQQGRGPVRLLLQGGGTYREVSIDERGGPKFPHLERVAGTPDELAAIAAPRRAGAKP